MVNTVFTNSLLRRIFVLLSRTFFEKENVVSVFADTTIKEQLYIYYKISNELYLNDVLLENIDYEICASWCIVR